MKAVIDRTTRIGRTRVSLVSLAAVLAALLVALAGVADTAEAKKKKGSKNPGQIVFNSDRTTGEGVNNPTGDFEIFVMNPNGTEVKQITFNTVDDYSPTVSPDLEKIAFVSEDIQQSNPQGDVEIYLMNADGSGQQNLTNNGSGIDDYDPDFSPDGKKIAYDSEDDPSSNPEGDYDVYLMNVDGSGQRNLTNTNGGADYQPDYAPDGKKIAYYSDGKHEDGSNPEGEGDIYLMNAADGSNKRNLTGTDGGIDDDSPDFSPSGKRISYRSAGAQFTNPQGDSEIYLMNALDGSGKKNLTDTGGGIFDEAPDFSPSGKKIAYHSGGNQFSNPANPEGDDEIYLIDADGKNQKNLTNTAIDIDDSFPDFAKAKKK